MKNKILPLINNCILSIFILISVSGCRIYWFDDFKGTFNDNFGIEYKYYIDESSESFISQKYVLGSILSSKDLLASSSKEVKNLNPGFILIGWKIKEYHNNSYYSSEPEYTLNDEDLVTGINVNYTSYDFYGVWEPSTNTPYIVKYLFETITEDGFDFEEDGKFTKKKKGTTLEQTAAEPIEVEGYECEEIEQQIIKGDGSTVVEVKLHRKDTTITFGEEAPAQKTGKYGTPVTYSDSDSPKKEGYIIDYWVDEAGHIYRTLPAQFPIKDITLRPVWKPALVKYKAYYHWENINSEFLDSYPNELSEKEFEGYTGDKVKPETKLLTEFGLVTYDENIEIKGDGTTTVDVYYHRKVILYTFDYNGGYDNSNNNLYEYELLYGSDFTTDLIPTDIKHDTKNFIGWVLSKTDKSPVVIDEHTVETNHTYYALWVDKTLPNITVNLPNYGKDEDIILSTSQTGNKLTVTAPTGYTSYSWYYDGIVQSSITNKAVFQLTNEVGIHEIVVIVKNKNNEYFSQTIQVVVSKGDI